MFRFICLIFLDVCVFIFDAGAVVVIIVVVISVWVWFCSVLFCQHGQKSSEGYSNCCHGGRVLAVKVLVVVASGVLVVTAAVVADGVLG